MKPNYRRDNYQHNKNWQKLNYNIEREQQHEPFMSISDSLLP